MALTIDDVRFVPYERPLALRTARAEVRVRAGWHVMLRAGAHCGWGDVAPWPGFGVDAAEVAALLAALDADAIGAVGAHDLPSPVAHGVEQALLDLIARTSGLGFAEVLGMAPAATHVATHRLVTDADEARAAVAAGAPALKVKVGADGLDDDDARVGRIRAAAPETPLRLDANGAWDREAAARAIDRLARHRPAWIEQPLAADDLDGFDRLRGSSPVALALDESVARFGTAALERAEVVVIKPMFVGGLRRARDLARAARALGATVCITHALESTVGRLGALYLAAGFEGPDGDGVHGLSGPGPNLPRGAMIAVPQGLGLGFAPRLEAA